MANRILAVLAFFLFLSTSTSSAQTLPDAPSHHFSKLYVAGQLSLIGVDAYQTYRDAAPFWKHDQGPWFYEMNPLARPFIQHGPSETIAYFGVEASVKIGGAYLLHRTHHHKLEKVWEAVSIGFSTGGVVSRLRAVE